MMAERVADLRPALVAAPASSPAAMSCSADVHFIVKLGGRIGAVLGQHSAAIRRKSPVSQRQNRNVGMRTLSRDGFPARRI
jgi:hypothetical protein